MIILSFDFIGEPVQEFFQFPGAFDQEICKFPRFVHKFEKSLIKTEIVQIYQKENFLV